MASAQVPESIIGPRYEARPVAPAEAEEQRHGPAEDV